MGKPVRRSRGQWSVGQWMGASVAAALAAVGVVALCHALETPQPLKSQLPGEALLYRWQRRSIFYKVLGSPDAPPLVLLHTPDIGASASEMRYIMSPLAQTYRVYALDLLGFGLSDRPAMEYSTALYSALCQDFLRDVVKRPATLAASGLSCNYAVSVAASAPEFCDALVLLAPIALLGNQQPAPLGEFTEVPLVKALLYPLLSTHLAFLVTHARQQGSRADFAHFYAQTHQLGAEHAAMALLAGKLTENAAQRFAALKQPVLMVWGTQALEDQHTIASMRDAATLADPKRRIREIEIIQQAGLAAHEEQPENVVAAIKRWQAETIAVQPAQVEVQIEIPQQAQFASNGVVSHELAARSGTEGVPDENELAAPARPETEVVLTSVRESSAEEHAELADSDPLVENEPDAPLITAYCVKCKQKRAILHAREVTMKNGRQAVRGTCAICGTKLNRIGGLS